MTVCR